MENLSIHLLQKQTFNMDRAEIYDRQNIIVMENSNNCPISNESDGFILRVIRNGIQLLVTGKETEKKNIKYEVKRLLSDGNIEVAMDKLEDYAEYMQERHIQTTVIMLSNRLNRLDRGQAQGTLSKEAVLIERNHIKKAVLDLVNQLPLKRTW